MVSSDLTVNVTVTFEAINDSPELQDLLRQLIREELAHLDPETVESLTKQISNQFEKKIRNQTGMR